MQHLRLDYYCNRKDKNILFPRVPFFVAACRSNKSESCKLRSQFLLSYQHLRLCKIELKGTENALRH